MKKTLILSIVLTAAAAVLQAGPVTYNLAFTGAAPLPTAGSFNYDSSLAVNPFSLFTFTEDGILFDLTTAANGFTGNGFVGACKSSASAAGFFNALTTPGCQNSWIYVPLGSSALFQISVCSNTTACDDGAAGGVASGTSTSGSLGLVSATAATATPEPGALWLSGTGFLALMIRAMVRRKRSAQPSAADSCY